MITITDTLIAGWLVGFVVAFIALSIYDGRQSPISRDGFGTVLSLSVFWPVTLSFLIAAGIIFAPLAALNWCYEKLAGHRL